MHSRQECRGNTVGKLVHMKTLDLNRVRPELQMTRDPLYLRSG